MIAGEPRFGPVRTPRRLPLRDRRLGLPGCARFGPDIDGFVLLLTSSAVSELRTGTERNTPREGFAVLVGRSFEDQQGPYTLVTHAVYAQRLQASAGHVRLDPEEMAALKQMALHAYAAEDVVGWSHSHTRESDYSQTDRDEQRTWPADEQVGVLTFMHGETWARAYRGPSARPLTAEAGSQEPRGAGLFARATDEDAEPVSSQPKRGVSSSRRGYRAAGCLVAGVALLLGLVFIGTRLDRQLGRLDVRIQALATESLPVPPRTVPWHCASRPEAPLQVSCSAPAGQGITGWLWDFGDGTSASGRSVLHTYDQPGAHAIGLTLLAPGGSADAGVESIGLQASTDPGLAAGCRQGGC